MSNITIQLVIAEQVITEKEIRLPVECIFTYDKNEKDQSQMTKNVYGGYLASSEPHSVPKKSFEKFCEDCSSVDWWYKNGDKGDEYFAIVYQDNFGKQNCSIPTISYL